MALVTHAQEEDDLRAVSALRPGIGAEPRAIATFLTGMKAKNFAHDPAPVFEDFRFEKALANHLMSLKVGEKC
jgi:hypothetical protein